MLLQWGECMSLWIWTASRPKCPYEVIQEWIWSTGRMYCSSISIVSGYGMEDPGDRGSIPSRCESIFPLASVSRPALMPTQPPVQWVPGVISPGVVNSPTSYSGGLGFKSRLEYWLSWLRCSRSFLVPPDKCWDGTLKLGLDHFMFHHSRIVLPFDAVKSE
jgi:hypothetical protein